MDHDLENIDLGEIRDVDTLLGRSGDFWPGREWVPAEQDYPGEPSGHLNRPKAFNPLVILYDCKTRGFRVTELDDLRPKQNPGSSTGPPKYLFSRLPSRRPNKTLYIRIERITPDGALATPRFRISNQRDPVLTMVSRHEVPLQQLSWGTKLRVLRGQIEWIFISNLSRHFSIDSQESANTAGTGAS